MTFQTWVDVSDGRCDFIFSWLDSEEINQLFNDALRLYRQFCKLNPVNWHLWMTGNESLTMIEQRSLKLFTMCVVRCEPLTSMLAAAIS